MTTVRRLTLVHSRVGPPCDALSTRRSTTCPDGHRCTLTEEAHRGLPHRCACRYSWRTVACLACRFQGDATDMMLIEHDATDWVCSDEPACVARSQALAPTPPTPPDYDRK